MKEKLHSFLLNLRAKNGEHEQALLRVVFTAIIFFYLINTSDYELTAAISFSVIYLSFSILMMLSIVINPASSEKRQWLSILADTSATTYVMMITHEVGVVFYGIYLWVIIGNGLRYGTKALIGTHLFSIVGFSIATQTNQYWLAHPRLAIGLLITLVLIPLYVLKLQRQLATAISTADNASKAKSQFLSHMSHEMRTPLNGIIGTSDLLMTTSLDEDQKDLVYMLKNSSSLLHRLIENVLDLAKIESGKITLENVDFDLHELISNTIEMFMPQATQKGLRLATRITPETHFMLRGDLQHLKQVIINLVGNAIKFTNKGVIDVRISTLEQSDSHTKLRFEVIDTGIGIAPEAQESIFESFQQADNSIASKFGGTGLGTSISRQLVTLMGGKIGMQSELNIGSIFWFELPFEKQSAVNIDQSPATLDKLHVITVGMNMSEQARVSSHLSGWGVKFKHESSPEHLFLQLAKRKIINQKGLVILYSPQNDGMDAKEFASHVLEKCPAQGVTIILASLDRQGYEEKDLFGAGYSSLLGSPVDKTLLFNALHGIQTPHQSTGVVSLKDYYERGNHEKRGINILVAEDNGTNRKIISRILEQAGHRAHMAENGEQALDMLENNQYDLMILDMNMPIMGGLEVVKIHRAIARGEPRIPILILTANATVEAMKECKAAGVDGYLTKPINAHALLDNIAQLTATSREADAAEHADASKLAANTKETMLVNEDTLYQLALLGKHDSFLQTLVHGFISETEKTLEAMRAAAAKGEYTTFRDLAHTIKGSSGNVGAEALHKLCCEMMELSYADSPSSMNELLKQAQGCFKDTKLRLIEYLGSSQRISI